MSHISQTKGRTIYLSFMRNDSSFKQISDMELTARKIWKVIMDSICITVKVNLNWINTSIGQWITFYTYILHRHFSNLPNSTSGTFRIVADLICIEEVWEDFCFTTLRGSSIGGGIDDGGGGGMEGGGGANNVGGGAGSIMGTIVAAGGASSGMLGLDFFFLPMLWICVYCSDRLLSLSFCCCACCLSLSFNLSEMEHGAAVILRFRLEGNYVRLDLSIQRDKPSIFGCNLPW